MSSLDEIVGRVEVPGKGPFGRRLIPNVIDDIAQTDPLRECFSIPRSSDPADGWRPVTFRQYANSINHVSRLIIDNCGRPLTDTFPTIAYIGPNDARYLVMLVAAVKAGYKALFISPRNPKEAQMNLFNKTDCHIMCFPTSHQSTVEPWFLERQMRSMEIGSIEDCFPGHDVEPFPYSKTFEQAEWAPLVVLHTSGSTGLPKPIVVKQGMLAIGDAYHNIPDWNGLPTFIRAWSEMSKRQFMPFPLFHAGGLYLFLIRAVYWGNPVALGIVDRPLSPDLVAECLDNLDVEGALIAPSILEDMSRNDNFIRALAKLKMVIFGGSNLSIDAGNKLATNGVSLVNGISTTEFSPFPTYWQPDPELWQYFVINSDILGCQWRKLQGESNTYQMVIVRKDKHPGYQGCFYTFPDEQEYDTKDVFKPHPSLPNHWVYYARSDDIIVLSNGEKLNPSTIEDVVGRHSEVKGVLVFGTNRFQPGLLIEPLGHPKDGEDANLFVERIWPSVAHANKQTVAHGRIARQLIILSEKRKPFLYGGKGTVQRASTLKQYEDKIDELYERADDTSNINAQKVDVRSEQALTISIATLFQEMVDTQETFEPDMDFFAAGVDSLQIINITRLLRSGLKATNPSIDGTFISSRAIYNNPTPRQLARYVYSVICKGEGKRLQNDEEQEIQTMRDLWQKYTTNLPEMRKGRPEPADNGQVIILTGSTGMLGSYLLDRMLQTANVEKIICLNRAEDGGEAKQAKTMHDRGLESDYISKVEFYHADLSQSDLGLPPNTFAYLSEVADRIIHNAWEVNLNIPVSSFESQLRGVRHLADFAAQARKRVALLFVSSISTVDRWNANNKAKVVKVPEKRLEDFKLSSSGYGRSKMIGSLILEDVATAAGFPAATIRVGQIAGPEAERGHWNKREWLPSLIASSLYMKALPNHLGSEERVDWTPCETIAKLVLDVAGVAHKVPTGDIHGYYHGVNPSATTWTALVPEIQNFYSVSRIVELISFGDWIDRLERSPAVDENPAVRLIELYRAKLRASEAGYGPVVLDMTRTLERSPAGRSASAVTPQMVRHWCGQWNF